jgi:hypothetical protein
MFEKFTYKTSFDIQTVDISAFQVPADSWIAKINADVQKEEGLTLKLASMLLKTS